MDTSTPFGGAVIARNLNARALKNAILSAAAVNVLAAIDVTNG